MYVPHKYVNIFLGHDLTLWQALARVWAAITTDGTELACAPLLVWLAVTCTCVAPNGISPLVRPWLNVPVVDEDLLCHQWQLVIHDLPVLDPQQVQHSIQTITSQILVSGCFQYQ